MAACSQQAVGQAQELVARDLRDPESAQFRDVEHHPENGAVCGQVNGKNAYGGYAGYVDFYVVNGAAHLAPADTGIYLDDVDQLNAVVERTRFNMDRIEACQSEPLRARLQQTSIDAN
jgi:hypothetical protein